MTPILIENKEKRRDTERQRDTQIEIEGYNIRARKIEREEQR